MLGTLSTLSYRLFCDSELAAVVLKSAVILLFCAFIRRFFPSVPDRTKELPELPHYSFLKRTAVRFRPSANELMILLAVTLIYGAISFAGIYPTMTAEETGAPFLGQFRQYFIAGNHDMYTFDLVHIPYARKLDELGLEYRFEIDNGEHSAAFFLPYLKEAFGYLMENASVPDGEAAAGENPVSIHDLQTHPDGEILEISFRAQIGDYSQLLPHYVARPSDQEKTAGSLTVPLLVTMTDNGKKVREWTELWILSPDTAAGAEEEFHLSEELPEGGEYSSDTLEVNVTADLSWASAD